MGNQMSRSQAESLASRLILEVFPRDYITPEQRDKLVELLEELEQGPDET